MESTRMHGGEECGTYLRAAKHPALIVFDLDGTIADSRGMARESYKRVFAMMGYGMITDELADSFNGPDADEVCRVMGIGPDRRELYDRLVDQNDVELTRTMGRMFPGTIRMLDELAPHATLAILTNGSQRYCEASIEAFALSPYIALHSGFVSGVSTRGALALYQAAQAYASLQGREYVIPEDIKGLAPAVLSHRISLGSSMNAEAAALRMRKLLAEITVPLESAE